MTPAEFVDSFGRARVSAILRTDDQRKAVLKSRHQSEKDDLNDGNCHEDPAGTEPVK